MSNGFEGLQSLLNPNEGSFLFGAKKTTPYPITKSLNSLSLEMCPETLGNESGSSIDPNLDEYSYLVLKRESCNVIKQRKARKCCRKNGVFPPPLSSMNGVRVEASREGGRLVITASNFRADRVYFKSERENGRLRLFFLKKKVEKDGENFGIKREVGELFASGRCNGSKKTLPSLPVCVAFS